MTHDTATAPDVLELIEMRLATLSTAERAIAEVILADPVGASGKTIGQLAQLAGSSEATVTRFCRSIGLPGYAHLRLRLAVSGDRRRNGEEVDGGIAMLGDLDPADPLSEIVRKVAHADTRAVDVTLAQVDEAELATVVDLLAEARRVLTYGVAASATAAFDAAAKLNLSDCAATAAHDVHSALMLATMYGPDDVLIAFSHSGRARDVVDLLQTAKERGVATVVVTSDAASPAARVAGHVLLTAARELRFRSGGVASRMAQLAIVDVLFVLLAHRRFDASVDAADAMHEAVAPYVIGSEKGGK
ncbi:MurR/RpiR family transcriptional regulator [Agromyces sp. ZXT2-6]|uniref:MurR/RpiR family transcriptional regulator n=1 Tax=Agromyces sp. ZXT2-6 TaxID=3461153 RepID=UPI004054CF64